MGDDAGRPSEVDPGDEARRPQPFGAGTAEAGPRAEPDAQVERSVFAPAQPPAGLGARWVAVLRDVILGGQDGLVNVLGLSLGLAAATSDTRVIVTAGLAAAMAESIAMAGVAFTASGAETSWIQVVGRRLRVRMDERARERAAGIRLAVEADGWDPGRVLALERVLDHERATWLGEVDALRVALAPVRERHPGRAAAIVGCSTLAGSAVPLTPFILLPVGSAALVAVVAGGAVLALVGAVRARAVGDPPWRPALEMVGVGLLSALAGFLIGLLLRSPAG
jgi:VIT1/CCC1 family predicted Fe2+/Mn2+ transporter